MAHYAFLDENNVVTEVISGVDEGPDVDWEQHYGDFRRQVCKRTSYNTQGNVHLLGGVPFRKNYAGIGYTFDNTLDAFIPPKPYSSWVLNTDTCLWEATVPYPGGSEPLIWDESVQNWVTPPDESPIPE